MSAMPHVIRLTKHLYRRVLSLSIRRSPIVIKLKQRLLSHDMLYDLDYYGSAVEGPAVRSAAAMADSIYAEFNPTLVIDVGCGTGALLEALHRKGCKAYGLDYSEAALMFCRARGLDVLKFDLERGVFHDDRIFDVAISLEVAEHLPPSAANRYVELLSRLSPIVVFSAAPPGHGGMDHVNEQLPSYWISKFRRHGFEYREALTRRWSDEWRQAGTVEPCYHEHLMVFRRASRSPAAVCQG
ncbi:MAG TPA: class I SAM-dependent methyltransferase [Nitrospira sp.]|nr:class I SAM-dependent methyltransferase [Nitrospira sp.]